MRDAKGIRFLNQVPQTIRGAWLRLVAPESIVLSPSEAELVLDVNKRLQAAGLTVDEAVTEFRKHLEAVEKHLWRLQQ